MTKRNAQRPIDVQDMPWSHIGKDELDKAAERVWNSLRPATGNLWPYHLASSAEQLAAQQSVLSILGTTVPKMLRQRAKELKADGVDVDHLVQLAEELEEEHGV
jgi:hypothetical protein